MQLLAALRNESKSFQLPSVFNSEQEVGKIHCCDFWYPFKYGLDVWQISNLSSQRFMQHFDLLQKARIPEGITYYSFKESAAQAHMAVSTQPCSNHFTSFSLCLF